ncbi:MAG: hypothetical protein ABSG73_15355 [Candidatus Aminicenantales bacterium]|jgi:hypothetical protein
MTKKKTAKAVEAVRTAAPAGTETKTKTAETKAKAEAKAAKPAKAAEDKEAKIQGQVDANAAAILKAHDEGKSVKELYKMFGIDKGLFCDLVYIVLWKAGRLPKSKYAERVAAKHSVMLDKRFVHARPERKEE